MHGDRWQSPFAPGIGLPGRVWSTPASPRGFRTSRATRTFRAPRSPNGRPPRASRLPIRQGSTVLGVMEFFSRDILEPTSNLLAMMTTVCSQIALYVERKWAGEELDRFFRLSLDLFCVATFDGYFVRVNPAWQTVLGFSEEELRASPFMDFVHPDDRAATIEAMSALLTGAQLIGFENRYRAKDGSYKWLQWTAAPFAAQGLIYAAARDVTDRKAAEGRMTQLVRELEVARERAEQADRGQGRVPRQHEPRDPHADERHHRHDRSDAADEAHAAAAGVPADDPRVRRSAADDHQRHPRRLEDRGAPADARPRAVPLPRHRRRRREAAAPRAPIRKGSSWPAASRRTCPTRRRRRGTPAADHPQSGRQRHQVHRRGRSRRRSHRRSPDATTR